MGRYGKTDEELLALGFDPSSNFWSKPGLAAREMGMYLVFLVIFCLVVFSPRNASPYELHRFFTDSLIEADYHPGENFITITDHFELYRWMKEIFLPTMYPVEYYDGSSIDVDSQFYVTGGVNRRVGKIRLRQVRVNSDSCPVPDVFKDSIESCYAPYKEHVEFTQPFEPVNGFAGAPAHLSEAEAAAFDRTQYWKDADELETQSWNALSKTTYRGSGYIFDLDSSYTNASSQVDWLENTRWIDESTRVLFIDFNVYNANVDLFCVARLVVEFMPAGAIMTSSTMRTLGLITPLRVIERDGKGLWTYLLVFIEGILDVFVLFYVYKEVKLYKLLGRYRYFTSTWNVLEMLNMALFLSTMILRLTSWAMVADERDHMNDDYTYVNLMPVSFFAQMVDNVNSFNAVLCFIKLFKFMRANKKLGQFTDTLQKASGEMVVLLVIIMILVCGYSIAFHMAFGHNLNAYKDFPEAAFTLFSSTLGDFDLESLREVNRYLGPLLFVSYMILMFFVIVSMFLSIVDNAYEEVRGELNARAMNPLTRDLRALWLLSRQKLFEKTGWKMVEVSPIEAEEMSGLPGSPTHAGGGGGGAGITPRSEAGGGGAGENVEMTVEMRMQEKEVMDRVEALEKQQTVVRDLLSQISSGLAP